MNNIVKLNPKILPQKIIIIFFSQITITLRVPGQLLTKFNQKEPLIEPNKFLSRTEYFSTETLKYF